MLNIGSGSSKGLTNDVDLLVEVVVVGVVPVLLGAAVLVGVGLAVQCLSSSNYLS